MTKPELWSFAHSSLIRISGFVIRISPEGRWRAAGGANSDAHASLMSGHASLMSGHMPLMAGHMPLMAAISVRFASDYNKIRRPWLSRHGLS
jgi:hypothetical protein